MKKLLSIVVPVYNEEENINLFYQEVVKEFKKIKNYNYEIIYVIDPSIDNTFVNVKELNIKDKKVKYILMANRFGKEASMFAGLKKAKGDLVSIMDVDLQDPPEVLIDMIKYIDEGYDSVCARRTNRKGEPPIRSFFSNIFYHLMNKTSNIKMLPGTRDFRLMTRRMVDKVLLSKEKNRFLKAIYAFTGFNTKYIEYKNVERKKGKTKWSFFGLYKYAKTCIYGFTELPLVIVNYLSIFMFISTIIMFLIYFILNMNNTYLIINFMMLFTSIILFSISIGLEYLYRIFIEVKEKPLYVIMDESD